MSFAFFLSFVFAAFQTYLIYRTIKFIGAKEYTKAFYCMLASFFLCGIGVFLVFKFINYIAQCFFGAVFGFTVGAIGGFIFKQFSPYTLKEWWQIAKSFALVCYGRLRIYIPKALKFLRERQKKYIYGLRI